MTRTVVALYDNFEDANEAVRELVDHGFRREDISFMAGDEKGEYGQALSTRDVNRTAAEGSTGAGVGAGVGAAVGGLAGVLIGLGALVIPGIGPVIAAGPLATVLAGLAGAGAGAVAGGALGALVDLGIPEETAGYYAEGIRRGGTLVTVQTEDFMTDRAVDVLNRHDPIDINRRVTEWKQSGWTGLESDSTMRAGQQFDQTGTMGQTDYMRDQEMDTTRAGMEMGDMGSRMDYTDEYTRYDPDFRTHFTSSPYSRQYTYEDYVPAYRYGYDLSRNPQYRGRRWDEIEMDVRRDWETTHPGNVWEEFKDSVRYAWDRITGQDQGSTYMGGEGHMQDRFGDSGMSGTGYTGSGTGFTQGDYSVFDTDYRNHFASSTYARDYTYNDYEPAYHYGYDLSRNPQYRGRRWDEIEMDVRRDWETRHPENAWEQFKDSVRHAWERAKDAVS